MKIFDSRQAAGPARIEALERSLSARLPEDYRAFLLAHNGGRPEPAGFGIPSLGDSSTVARFLALDGSPWDDLEAHLRCYAGRIPRGWLPVASDDLGNLLLIPLAGPARGRVFFWDHDAESATVVAPTWPVADSFAAFFQSLA